jgi:hypothetical protein
MIEIAVSKYRGLVEKGLYIPSISIIMSTSLSSCPFGKIPSIVNLS